MSQLVIQLEELACPSCMEKIKAAISHVDGVDQSSIKVLFNASKAKLRFDEKLTDAKTIAAAIETIGYKVLKTKVSA
ncbi:heavy-metal-associated domain-containing protein [Streptococcus jiangjianxini]|uniref:heavy-metal-associated domain-containing protein n=1 Tax=Streptococcus jiangjianxini TaxID=3161189 RepID=UPI0032EFC6B8